jgi:glutaredoxin-like protein NrdH
VSETQNRNVTLYALSTCGWCKMARSFLDENNVEYECIYVDLLSADEKDKTISSLTEKLGRRPAFPTVFCDDQFVVGFQKERLQEILGL